NSIWRLNLRDEKDRQGSPAVVISAKGPNLARAHFSPGGKKIAFESDRFGYPEIWACGNDGSNCGQLTSLHGTAGAASWSADGRFLYYAKLDVPGIWRMPLQGGEETLILDQPYVPFAWWDWALGRNGIYFINFETKPDPTIGFFELATHKIIPIWTFTKSPFVGL